MDRPGVITGLAQEADCLDVFPAGARPTVGIAAARPANAAALAGEMISSGSKALLSFGMAGGLSADLKAGAVIVASSVIAPDGTVFETSVSWLEKVRAVIGEDATIAAIAGSDAVVASPEAKRALAEDTGAIAVDMESHAVARVAAAEGAAFLIIRAVADPVDRAIPAWVLGNISDAGRPRTGAILAGLALRPWDLAALVGLKGDSDRALASLRRVAGRLGPSFGFE